MWGFCVPCQEVVCIFALLKLELDFAPCWFVLPAAWPSILGKLISYLQGKTGKLAGYHESGARGCKKWLMLLDWIIKVDLCCVIQELHKRLQLMICTCYSWNLPPKLAAFFFLYMRFSYNHGHVCAIIAFVN
jgi:hypothetical protein